MQTRCARDFDRGNVPYVASMEFGSTVLDSGSGLHASAMASLRGSGAMPLPCGGTTLGGGRSRYPANPNLSGIVLATQAVHADFALPLLGGGEFTLSSLRGRPVMKSWTCRIHLPFCVRAPSSIGQGAVHTRQH